MFTKLIPVCFRTDRLAAINSRVGTARHYLDEFDGLLEPMWRYLLDGGEIKNVREQLRQNWKNYCFTSAKEPERDMFDELLDAVQAERRHNAARKHGEPFRNEALMKLCGEAEKILESMK